MIGRQINRSLLLCQADVARDIQVVFVLLNLFETDRTAESFFLFPCAVGLHYLVDVLRQQLVLLLALLETLGGVDEDEYYEECLNLVDTLSLKDDIIFAGQVDVVEYMKKIDFTVLTSISEGQPLSVLESLAARRPCVTTDVGCCRDLLEGGPGDQFGVAGFLAPPMHREGIAHAMDKMCRSKKDREKMGEVGQRRVDAYFRHENMIKLYADLYKSVI